MTFKEKYNSIDQSKLPENAKAFMAGLKEDTANFTNKEIMAKIMPALDRFIDKLKESGYGDAIKGAPKKETKKAETPTEKAKEIVEKAVEQPETKTGKPKVGKISKGDFMKIAKEIRKEGETWNSAMKRAGEIIRKQKEVVKEKAVRQYEKLKKFIEKHPEVYREDIPVRGGGYRRTTVSKDAPRVALAKGKRVSKAGWKNQYGKSDGGKTYYEYRSNRYDTRRQRYPYLAEGGEVEEKKLRFDVYGYINANNRAQDEDMAVRVSSYEELEKFAQKLSKDKNLELVEIYRRDTFVGSVRNSGDFVYSSRYRKTEFAKGGELEYGSMTLKYDFPKHKRKPATTVYLKPDTSKIVKIGGLGENGYNLLYKDGKNSNLVIEEKNLDKLKNGEIIESSGAVVSLSDKYAKGGELDMNKYAGAGMFARGGELNERMYNFLNDDLSNLEQAIQDNDSEEIQKFFSYWGQHLKSLKTENNERMYNFMVDDLADLEKAVEENNQEEIDKFFSYWNQHLPSLKMAKGGYTATGEDYEYINTFGIPQDDFNEIVEAWHMTNSLRQTERVNSRLVFRRMENKYGEDKIEEISKYIYLTHEGHEHYANGGETSGNYVAVSENKGYWYIMSTPTSKQKAQEIIDMGVPSGEVGKVVTLDEAKSHKKVIGRQYLAKGGVIANYRIIPYKRYEVKNNPDLIDAVYSSAFTVSGTLSEAEQEAQEYVKRNSPEIVSATITKIHPSGQPLKNKKVAYVTKDEISKYAKGGSISKNTTYISNRNIESIHAKIKDKKVTLKGKDILDGVYAKNESLKTPFEKYAAYDEIANMADAGWDALNIESGSQIYNSDATQKKLADYYEKNGIDAEYLKYNAAQRKIIADVLTDENQHALRNYFALRGYIGESEYNYYKDLYDEAIKEKRKIFLNPANITHQPKKKFAKGGELSDIKIGDVLISSTGVKVKVVDYDSRFGGRIKADRMDEFATGKPSQWMPIKKFKKFAEGGETKSYTKYVVRQDILDEEQSVPVGDDYVSEGVFEGRYNEDGSFEIKLNGKWQEAESIDWEEYAKGGKIGFKGLSDKVAKYYANKSVPSKYRSLYGKKYDKSEAKEVGDKVAAKVYRQQQAKKK